jgi:hypothetical protein
MHMCVSAPTHARIYVPNPSPSTLKPQTSTISRTDVTMRRCYTWRHAAAAASCCPGTANGAQARIFSLHLRPQQPLIPVPKPNPSTRDPRPQAPNPEPSLRAPKPTRLIPRSDPTPQPQNPSHSHRHLPCQPETQTLNPTPQPPTPQPPTPHPNPSPPTP